MSKKKKKHNSNSNRNKQSFNQPKKVRRTIVGIGVGTLSVVPGGFGFVILDSQEESQAKDGGRKQTQKWNVWKRETAPVPNAKRDIFVPSAKLKGALDGDRVKVGIEKCKGDGQHSEGRIIEVLKRSDKIYTGTLKMAGNRAWADVENRRMPYDVDILNFRDLKPEYKGMKVAVRITDFPRGHQMVEGKFLSVLGKPGDNDTEMNSILLEYGLPVGFPSEVEEAANKIPSKITAKERAGRRDFRDTCTFTIDPADAKDFDDACSIKRLDNGNWEIGVHIADVSHYVKPGSVLDKEAYARATSVYLVDRTVPMLPEKLSNNLCSLRPGEEKLTFSAVFEMDEKGKVLNEWFGRTIIKSSFRFAYEEAQQIIDNEGNLKKYVPILSTTAEGINTKKNKTKNAKGAVITNDVTGLTTAKPSKHIADMVLQLHKLATLLRKKRFAEGSIQFERPEMKVLTDAAGRPINVVEKVAGEANWLIEEFMLLANKGVAAYVSKKVGKKAPTFVYRVHDQPNMDKVAELKEFVKHFGYVLDKTDTPTQLAKSLNKLTAKVKGTAECDTIELLALRCMAKAEYSTDNIGHYGLGFQYYTHFTSPIRRYPDTMVHRLLAQYLAGGKSADKQQYEEYCKHSSEREQLATDAERASIKYKMVEYMQKRVGEEYDGIVSGVTDRGIFVQVEPTKIEGMVPLRDMKDDIYIFDEKNYCVVGQNTRRKFTLGDRVRARVERADLDQKTIDFSLV